MDFCSFMAARLVSPVFFSFFHSGCLIFMFLYLWSKQSPEAPISLYGFIKLQGTHAVTATPPLLLRDPCAASLAATQTMPTAVCSSPNFSPPPPPLPAHPAAHAAAAGKHLPFAFLALDLLMGADIWTDILGILCGHV